MMYTQYKRMAQALLALVMLGTAVPGALISGTIVKARSEVAPASIEMYFPFLGSWKTYVINTNGADTPIQTGKTEKTPDRIFLDQNYPNPFNPSTMIRYGIPSDTKVRLTVHTLLGTEVKVLVDDRQAAGTYVYDFAALDLPSGAYFYRLQTAQGTLTRRMTISK